jgi:hypothetical protein
MILLVHSWSLACHGCDSPPRRTPRNRNHPRLRHGYTGAEEFKHITVVANGGVNKPIHDPERDATGTLDFGFGRALTRHVAAMAEVRFISTFDLKRERLLVVNFGLMRRLRDNVVLYANVGRSIFFLRRGLRAQLHWCWRFSAYFHAS